jgi:hypothetical protein
MTSQNPFVRLSLLLDGQEIETVSTEAHSKGGAYPVWNDSQAHVLKYQPKVMRVLNYVTL